MTFVAYAIIDTVLSQAFNTWVSDVSIKAMHLSQRTTVEYASEAPKILVAVRSFSISKL